MLHLLTIYFTDVTNYSTTHLRFVLLFTHYIDGVRYITTLGCSMTVMSRTVQIFRLSYGPKGNYPILSGALKCFKAFYMSIIGKAIKFFCGFKVLTDNNPKAKIFSHVVLWTFLQGKVNTLEQVNNIAVHKNNLKTFKRVFCTCISTTFVVTMIR